MLRIYIRGMDCLVTGFIEGGDPSVGLFGGGFIPDAVFSRETGLWLKELTDDTDHRYLTESEEIDIDRAYWQSLPFDECERTLSYNQEENDIEF